MLSSRAVQLAFAAGVLFGAARAGAEPVRLQLDPNRSRVEYHIEHSISPVTDLAGTPAGEVSLEPDVTAPRLRGRVTVDLRQLRTGISRRDHHIRSSEYLDVEHDPVSEFQLESLRPDSSAGAPPASGPEKSPEGAPTWKGVAHGTLALHGVTREVEVPVALWWGSDATHPELRVLGQFVLELADYHIKRPKKLFFSAGKNVRVRLDLVFGP